MRLRIKGAVCEVQVSKTSLITLLSRHKTHISSLVQINPQFRVRCENIPPFSPVSDAHPRKSCELIIWSGCRWQNSCGSRCFDWSPRAVVPSAASWSLVTQHLCSRCTFTGPDSAEPDQSNRPGPREDWRWVYQSTASSSVVSVCS